MVKGSSDEVIDKLISELDDRYPNRDKLKVITAYLSNNKKNRYDQFLAGRTLAYTLAFDILEVAEDLHLAQVYWL